MITQSITKFFWEIKVLLSREIITHLIKHEFDANSDAYLKFQKRFMVEFYKTQKDIDEIVERHKITHLYIIKAGIWDGLVSTKCVNLSLRVQYKPASWRNIQRNFSGRE